MSQFTLRVPDGQSVKVTLTEKRKVVGVADDGQAILAWQEVNTSIVTSNKEGVILEVKPGQCVEIEAA